MTRPAAKTGAKIGTVTLVIVLLGILAMSGWYAASAWIAVDSTPMPTQGYVAMTIGVVLSIALGCVLMVLVFYSSRYGYDERANQDQHLTGEDDRELASPSNPPAVGAQPYESERLH
jgi:hypothetical protein